MPVLRSLEENAEFYADPKFFDKSYKKNFRKKVKGKKFCKSTKFEKLKIQIARTFLSPF
jgi:hypothetical protein